MPLYEELARRAMEARSKAERLSLDSKRVKALAHILREAEAGKISIRRCAWCERFDIGGEWLHLEAIGNGQRKIAATLLDRATHGICPQCLAGQKRKSADRWASRK